MDDNTKLQLTLAVKDINQILMALSELPLKYVYDIVNNIKLQVDSQINKVENCDLNNSSADI